MQKINNGFSILVLVITITIIVIVATAIIIAVNYNMGSANEAVFKTNLRTMQEKLHSYKAVGEIEKVRYNSEYLEWNGKDEPINTAKLENGESEDTIEYILGEIPKNLEGKICIKNGLIYLSDVNQIELLWAKEINISKINIDINRYKESTDTKGGITASCTKDGVVTLNGTTTDAVFIKITDGVEIVEMANMSSAFNEWINNTPVLAEPGDVIKQKVSIISGTYTNTATDSIAQINSVIRTKSNIAIANCKIVENKLEYTFKLSDKASLGYIYISQGMNLNDFQFKIELYKEQLPEKTPIINFYDETIINKNLTISMKKDGTITINGSTDNENIFVRLEEGLDVQKKFENESTWYTNSSAICSSGEKIRLEIDHKSGTATANQVNCVLRYKNLKKPAINCMLMNGTFSDEVELEDDVSILYMYIYGNSVFNNYVIKPKITIL